MMQRIPEPEYMDLDAEAEAYALADFNAVNAAFIARALELISEKDAILALDLGTGPGDIPVGISTLRPHWRLIGLDAARAMLRFARARALNAGVDARTCYVQADAKALPFPDNSFNVILSNSILHHVEDVSLFWRELSRIAAPGALVFLRDLSRPPTQADARRIVDLHAAGESPLLQEEFYRSLLAAYTPAEVRTQVLEAGLGTLSVAQATDRHLDVCGHAP